MKFQSEIYKKIAAVHEQAVDIFQDGSKKIMELAQLVVHPNYRGKQLGYRLAKVSNNNNDYKFYTAPTLSINQ